MQSNNKQLKIEFRLLLLLLWMTIFGLFILYSASLQSHAAVVKQGISFLLGWLILYFCKYIPEKYLKYLIIILYALGCALLLATESFGLVSNGAKRWLNIFGIRFQPSELMKIVVPIFVALLIKYNVKNNWLIWFKAIFASILPAFLIMRQPDLGTALMVLFMSSLVLFIAGVPKKLIVIIICILLLSTPILWHNLHDYQKSRIMALLETKKDLTGTGYQVWQSKIAIGSGGFFGRGYMQGTQSQLQYLPEARTDFIFATLAEEFGVVGVVILAISYIALTAQGIYLGLLIYDRYYGTIVCSFAMMPILVAIVNIGMVAGLLPVVGIPLPFLSYGGSFTISIFMAYGIIFWIANKNREQFFK